MPEMRFERRTSRTSAMEVRGVTVTTEYVITSLAFISQTSSWMRVSRVVSDI